MRHSRLLVALILGLSLLTSACKDQQADTSQDLINAFAGSCTSRGFWTDAALYHTNSLVGVLENLKSKDPCKPFEDTLVKVQALESQLNFMLNNTAYKDYRVAEENIQEITLELNKPEVQANAELTASLTAALAQQKATLASKRAAYNVDKFNNATAQLGQTVQQLSMRAKDLSACMARSPGPAVQIATNALALGGSFISPVLGAGVAVVGQLLNGSIEYIRGYATNDAIWKLYSAKMPMALTCGLEAMTQLYCQANDAFTIIDLQKQNYSGDSPGPSDLWKSLDILGRRMPILNRYLLKVKTGVVPSSPDEADRQVAVWKKVQQFDNVSLYVAGSLNKLSQYYEASKGQEDSQRNLVIKFITDMAGGLSYRCDGNGCTNWAGPFADLTNDSRLYACYFVLGMEASKTQCPKKAIEDTGESWMREKLLPLVKLDDLVTGQALKTNWSVIQAATKNLVDIEFSQTITVDPSSLLDLAFEDSTDNISPRQVLSLIKDFLEEMLAKDDGKNPHQAPLIRSTLDIIVDVSTTLDSHDPNLKPIERVRTLFEKFELRNGAKIFTERVTNLAASDIRDRLKKGEYPKEIADLLRTAGIDIHDRLLAAGVLNLGRVVDDLNNSRSLIESNIRIFRDFFAPSFARAIKELDAQTRRSGEPAKGPNRPNGQTLAKLCTLLISTGYNRIDKDSAAICSRARLTSIYADPKNANDPLDIDVGSLWGKIKDKGYMDRVCTYYRYLRAERLAEVVKGTRLPKKIEGKPAKANGFWENFAEPAIGFDWVF